VLATGIFAVAVTEAVWVVRPFRVGPVGSDSTSTVLYFDRILSGQQLEIFLGTAPKPLLSLIYGPLYFTFQDWRPISWTAILVYGLAVAATALLAGRVSRSNAAAVFTATGLLASTGLLTDVSVAYTVSWALLGWSLAGLAVTANRPRYGLAGTALMLAGLVRPETWFITVLGGSCIGAVWLHALARGVAPPPRRAWLVMIGLLAVPVGALHDWLLTRDPFYIFATPSLGSAIRPLQDPGYAAEILNNYVESSTPLLLLALVGLAALSIRRAWPLVIGLVALGPVVAAFLLYQGARQIYVLERYALPIGIAVTVAAGIGFAALAVAVLAPYLEGSILKPARGMVLAIVAVGVAVTMVPAVAPFDQSVLDAIHRDRQLVLDFQAAAPTIEEALDGVVHVRDMPSLRDPDALTPPARPALLVPARVYPMAAVQFGLPLTQVARLVPRRVRGVDSYLSAGQIVMFDRIADLPAGSLRSLQIGQPAMRGPLCLVPLLAKRYQGIWVVSVEPAGRCASLP
jgi:hypothetical protein